MSIINSIINSSWITAKNLQSDTVSPIFKKEFFVSGKVKKATLNITALGVYKATLNGNHVGDFVMAPGWTSYNKRLQYQEYDITQMLKSDESSTIEVTLGNGWCIGRLVWKNSCNFWGDTKSLIASINITYLDNTSEIIYTDETWQTASSNVLFSEIYDGETYDARIVPNDWSNAEIYEHDKAMLIPQDGEIVKEMERLKPIQLITTPKGECVIDFGQNLTGYVEFSVKGKSGDICELSHAEVLDKDGNFYTENMRTAKNKIIYICNGEKGSYKPNFTFQGFRYVRLDRWAEEVELSNFTAIVVHSDMKRTGSFECSNPLVNKLYENIIWGQKGNFLDVPTDCPQRDERLGWTGDAQVFVKAASYNFDVEKFFKKWLRDLSADQLADGRIPHVIPAVLGDDGGSAAWGDAAVICPWQIYLTYGDKSVLKEQFTSMKKWIEYIKSQGENPYLWNTGDHFGDWLGLDVVNPKEGDCNGATDKTLIATAYFAYSTSLLIKAGKVLGYDMAEYESLHQNIVLAFNEEYVKDDRLTSETQTAYVLALYFDLVKDKALFAKRLATLIEHSGNTLTTGFVGTPYLLHALAENGYLNLAYKLLVQENYPSWLYSVKKGATTIWEHWDGIKVDGSMWSVSMNSFNHYAYGAVADFMYEVICGINIDENAPGFKHIIFKPMIDNTLTYAKAAIDTHYGKLSAEWHIKDDVIKYNVQVPQGATATVILGDSCHEISSGAYEFSLNM